MELVPTSSEHADELRRIRRTPDVLARWGELEDGFPFEEPESTRFTVLVDDDVRGMIQYYEESEPMYRHAGIDIFLDPAVHGRGIGRAAVGRIAELLVHERGHHRIVIDPAADNEAAIRCYRAVGFRPVGLMRQHERGPDGTWHDSLLMDLLADELTAPDSD